MEVIEKQLDGVRGMLEGTAAPKVQGIKQQIIEYLGIEAGKPASIRAANVLKVARKELSLTIPRGSRYTRKQGDEIMAWLTANG